MSLFLKINFQVYPQVGLKAKDEKDWSSNGKASFYSDQ
jgi:hypothetical protein